MIVMYAAVLSFKVKSKISPTKTNEVRSKTEIKCEKRCLLTGFFLTANFILCYLPLFTLQLIKVNGASRNREKCLELDGVSNLLARVNNLINPFIINICLGGGLVNRIRSTGKALRCKNPGELSINESRLMDESFSYDYSEDPYPENDLPQKSVLSENQENKPLTDDTNGATLSEHKEENKELEIKESENEEIKSEDLDSETTKPNPLLNKTISLEITIANKLDPA